MRKILISTKENVYLQLGLLLLGILVGVIGVSTHGMPVNQCVRVAVADGARTIHDLRYLGDPPELRTYPVTQMTPPTPLVHRDTDMCRQDCTRQDYLQILVDGMYTNDYHFTPLGSTVVSVLFRQALDQLDEQLRNDPNINIHVQVNDGSALITNPTNEQVDSIVHNIFAQRYQRKGQHAYPERQN